MIDRDCCFFFKMTLSAIKRQTDTHTYTQIGMANVERTFAVAKSIHQRQGCATGRGGASHLGHRL